MREINEDDIACTIQMKNHILAFPPEKLSELYGACEKTYNKFLDNIVVISQKDYAFFLLDSRIIDSIRKVIETRRDNYKSGIILDCINSIIVMCNSIEHMDDDEKNRFLSQYFLLQSDMRNISISSPKQMMAQIIYDEIVYDAVLNNDWTNAKSEGFLLGSLMYLSVYTPSFLLKNKGIILNKLSCIKRNAGLFNGALKEYVKSVSETINNINCEKEE